jgi:hypothetical protein
MVSSEAVPNLSHYRGEDWAWSKFTEVAQHMIRTSSPLILPKDNMESMDLPLSYFLQSTLLPSAELSRLELCRYGSGKGDFLVLYFTVESVDYCLYVPETPPKQQFWALASNIFPFAHVICKVWASSSLEEPSLRGRQVLLTVHFREGANQRKKNALQVISEDIWKMERSCLRYYFFNCKCWKYTWALVHKVVHHEEKERVYSYVMVGDGEEVEDWDLTLRERHEQWRHAEMKRYGNFLYSSRCIAIDVIGTGIGFDFLGQISFLLFNTRSGVCLGYQMLCVILINWVSRIW